MSSRKLGMVIKRLRVKQGLTQAALAKKARIARVYLAQLEGSAKTPPRRTPSLRTLERVAKALKVSVTELLG